MAGRRIFKKLPGAPGIQLEAAAAAPNGRKADMLGRRFKAVAGGQRPHCRSPEFHQASAMDRSVRVRDGKSVLAKHGFRFAHSGKTYQRTHDSFTLTTLN